MSELDHTIAELPNPPQWFRAGLETLAVELGRLRRETRGTRFAWRVDVLCDVVWTLLAATTRTAANLYRETSDVDAALAAADAETRRLNRMLADVA